LEFNVEIVAYKCVDTGKIFELELDYDTHRTTFLTNRRIAQTRADNVARFVDMITQFQNTCTDIDELSNWIMSNQQTIIDRASMGNTAQRKLRKNEQPFKLLSVEFTDIYHSLIISNSHSAPKGFPTNWRGSRSLPLGYPGSCARINITYQGNYSGFISDVFNILDINLGCGGGGGSKYQAEVRIFDADWPGMSCYRALTQNG